MRPVGPAYGGSYFWNDEKEDNFSMPGPVATAKGGGAALGSRKRGIVGEEEDDDNMGGGVSSRISSSALAFGGDDSGYKIAVPVRHFDQANTPSISRRAKDAVTTVLQEIKLPREVAQHLQLYSSYMDELTKVDPLVHVSYTVLSPTEEGSCKIYTEEVVPFSDLMLARQFKITAPVQITKKVRYDSIEFAKDLRISPYLGEPIDDQIQPCGLVDAVTKRLQALPDHEDLMIQIKGYMTSLGPLAPEVVAADGFIEEQTDVFTKLVSGEFKPVVRVKIEEK